LHDRAEAQRDPAARDAVPPARLRAGHGLADRLPRPLHQVGAPGRGDLVGPGRDRRHGGRPHPAPPGRPPRGPGDRPPGRGPGALGAHQSFPPNAALPRKVRAVIDSVGLDSWAHSLSSLARGGTLVTVGGTTGFEVPLNLLPVVADQLTIIGSIMGTLKDME